MRWKWTAAQAAILRGLTRYVQISGGRRAGKSLFTARWLGMQIVDALRRWEDEGSKPVEGGVIPFWFVGKSYEASRQEFKYLEADMTRQFGVKAVSATSRAIGPNEITIAGHGVQLIVRTKSADDEQTLEMEAPAAIAVCEAAQISYSAYIRLLGRIAEKRAPLLLSGSLENDWGWYVDVLNDWSSERVWREEGKRSWILESETNQWAFPGGSDDEELQKLKRELSEDDFNRMFMGRPAPPRGLVHHSFRMTTHVQDVPYIPGEDVWLAIDPGIAGPEAGGSAYAVLACHIVRVQGVHDQIRVFDSVHVDNLDEDTLIGDLVMGKKWWGKSDIYGVIDRAGAARRLGAPPIVQAWRKLSGVRLRWAKKAVRLRDQRERFNSLLKVNEITKEPGIVMDARRTKGLQSELGGCASPLRPTVSDQVYRWNLDQEGNVMGKEPRDKHCDAIKALYYLAYDRFGPTMARNTRVSLPQKRFRTLRTREHVIR